MTEPLAEGGTFAERHALNAVVSDVRAILGPLTPSQRCYVLDTIGTEVPRAAPDPRCPHKFPLPSWMGADQDEPCRCDLPAGHEPPHSCEHLRATGQEAEAVQVSTSATSAPAQSGPYPFGSPAIGGVMPAGGSTTWPETTRRTT